MMRITDVPTAIYRRVHTQKHRKVAVESMCMNMEIEVGLLYVDLHVIALHVAQASGIQLLHGE